MKTSTLKAVREEIEALHEFFCGWFSGQLPEAAFETQFLARFSEDLVFIPPAGSILGLTDLRSWIQGRYATNPDFRIQIRNVAVIREFDNHILATYEEWQRNALASKPADNGRIATVVFERSERLHWAHIHETWLPKALVEQDNFDF